MINSFLFFGSQGLLIRRWLHLGLVSYYIIFWTSLIFFFLKISRYSFLTIFINLSHLRSVKLPRWCDCTTTMVHASVRMTEDITGSTAAGYMGIRNV